MSKEDIVKILWTGGFDSTYRIIELSMRNITVQPIYVEDPGRRSIQYELKAMNEIQKLLAKREQTKAKFLPIIKIKLSDIPPNKEITKAWCLFKEESEMGSQHDWLARLSVEYPMMEICIEKALGEHAPIRNSILKHGKLIKTDDGYIVDKNESSKELNLVLGNLRLPIFDKTELEMMEDIKKWGYEDIISHIWFCHAPINEQPCGICNPCNTKIDSKLDFLLSAKAIKRNTRMKKIEKLFGKKIKKLYVRLVRKFDK